MGRPALNAYLVAAGFLAAVTLGMLAVMAFGFAPRFQALTHLQIPDLRLAGYEAADVKLLMSALEASPEAAALLRRMHLLPDMIFPAAYAALAVLLLVRHAPGAMVFHKPLAGYRLGLVLAAPIAYAAADYAENIISLMLLPPAMPDGALSDRLIEALPLATRAKAMLFFVTLILVLRFTLFRERQAEKTGTE